MKIEVGEVGVVVELGFEEPEKVLGRKGWLKMGFEEGEEAVVVGGVRESESWEWVWDGLWWGWESWVWDWRRW